MTGRHVILLCGPPGAGKTTHAHQLGLDVYDIDDPHWNNNERHFKTALTTLGRTPDAQAVVIRSGATRHARQQAARTVGATHIQVIDTDLDECIRRIRLRARPRPPLHQQIAAARDWHDNYEPDTIRSRTW